MKRQDTAKGTNVFLLELLVSILFFAVAAGICVQFFVQSHTYSKEAQRLSKAVKEVSSVCEIAAASESIEDFEALLSAFRSRISGSSLENAASSDASEKEDRLYISYDDGLLMTIRVFEKDGFLSGNASVSDEKENDVYALDFCKYLKASPSGIGGRDE